MGAWKRAERYPVSGVGGNHYLENTAAQAVTGQIHELVELLWDDGDRCYAFVCCHIWTGHRMPEMRGGRSWTKLVDLETGEDFWIASFDYDIQAMRLTLKQLPKHILDAWPDDGKGIPVKPGLDLSMKERRFSEEDALEVAELVEMLEKTTLS